MRPFPNKLPAALVLAGVASACGAAGEEREIGALRAAVRGGASAATCEWPAVVALDRSCSATLVHPEVVVYAAHCGEAIESVSFGESTEAPERVVSTRRCVRHPDAELGNGFDVAFCLLGEPVADVPVVPIAAGCELDAVRAGATATLVGFGLDADEGSFGVKRSAPAQLDSVALDLRVTANQSGTCSGDSGGPLLLEVGGGAGQPGSGEHRLIGVVSAARDAACGPTVDHYSYLPPLLAWLEDASGRDLTPCFAADGSWAPAPSCTLAASRPSDDSWSAGCGPGPLERELSARCGAPFAREQLSENLPPALRVLSPSAPETHLASAGGRAETALEAIASDAETGVAEVRFELLDAAGVTRATHRDEVPPYRLEHLRLPDGAWDVVVTARDHAGNETEEAVSYSVGSSGELRGCALGASRVHAGHPGHASAWLVALVALRRRRRHAT